nr:hypothetical protein Iba_chr10bCG13400 [Ipomoea batatas]
MQKSFSSRCTHSPSISHALLPAAMAFCEPSPAHSPPPLVEQMRDLVTPPPPRSEADKDGRETTAPHSLLPVKQQVRPVISFLPLLLVTYGETYDISLATRFGVSFTSFLSLNFQRARWIYNGREMGKNWELGAVGRLWCSSAITSIFNSSFSCKFRR